jgi:hypothetical protein
MSGTYWNKMRDDENHILFVLKSDSHVSVTAERTNPAPIRKWQGWYVYGYDRRGTFFKSESLDFKKDARVQIEIAKNKYEQAHAERFK